MHALTGRGFRVYEADSAAEARLLCEALPELDITLIITGDPISGATGRAVAEQVLSKCRTAKVLHLSASSIREMEAVDGLVPGSAFLKKPFTSGELLEAVRATLEPRTH
jgi:DNA-binding response OmpR family regulator